MFIPLPTQPASRQPFKPYFKPYAVRFLIITNLIVFVYQLYACYYRKTPIEWVYGAIPSEILPYIFHKTLITSLFLHDVQIIEGGFIHLIGNMLYLSAFGPNLENRIGSLKFLLLYLLCGVASTLFYVFAHHNSDLPLIGASGAIAGIMGAHVIACPKAHVRCLLLIYMVSRPASHLIAPWIGIQLLNAYLSHNSGPIAWLAHLGGFGAGIFLLRKFQRLWFGSKREGYKIRPYVRPFMFK